MPSQSAAPSRPQLRQRRQRNATNRASSERWLLSYADMITLLFCLFIVLYAMSKLNEAKFHVVAEALARAINHGGPGNRTAAGAMLPLPLALNQGGKGVVIPASLMAMGPGEAGKAVHGDDAKGDTARARNRRAAEDAALLELANRLKQTLARAGFPNAARPHLEDSGLAICLVEDRVLFDLDEADVRPAAIPMLLTLCRPLRQIPNSLRLEGSTDDLPIHGGRFHSNWELSTMRATNVAEILINRGGIHPQRVSVLGRGQWKPLVPNTNDANRQRNRRVEVIVLRDPRNVESR